MKASESISATVMVIDDTPVNLKLMERSLMSRGHRVMAFPNGSLALEAARHHPPDIILLDIMMPGVDGFETLRRFREVEVLRDIPVIFISALNDSASKVRAFAALRRSL